jgi:hypothetical protein
MTSTEESRAAYGVAAQQQRRADTAVRVAERAGESTGEAA